MRNGAGQARESPSLGEARRVALIPSCVAVYRWIISISTFWPHFQRKPFRSTNFSDSCYRAWGLGWAWGSILCPQYEFWFLLMFPNFSSHSYHCYLSPEKPVFPSFSGYSHSILFGLSAPGQSARDHWDVLSLVWLLSIFRSHCWSRFFTVPSTRSSLVFLSPFTVDLKKT